MSQKNLTGSRCHWGMDMLAFAFLGENPAVFAAKILGFFLWLSAKKLKRQSIPRACSARQIFLQNCPIFTIIL